MTKVEVFSKDWCPFCTKAKALLKSKDIDYTEIDITSDAVKELEMIERSKRRSVPQIFINDESIGGYDDLANINATGQLDTILGINKSNQVTTIYDVVVIGAGPAGITAAVYAARKNLSTLVIAMDIGGQLGTTAEIANYPGIKNITGPDLATQLADHMDEYHIEKLIGEKVTNIAIKDRCKVITTASHKSIHARSVIIATGANKRKMNIPGEEEFASRGVVYCATCDGPLFKDLNVAVIGGGNSGLEAAIEMSAITPQVYLISRGELSGDAILKDKIATLDNIRILTAHDPVKVVGDDQVSGLVVRNLHDNKQLDLDVEGVFVEIGLYPNTDFSLDLIETNKRGEIVVADRGTTGVKGVFAAGDATHNNEKQIIVAAGSGANAALAASAYLIKQI